MIRYWRVTVAHKRVHVGKRWYITNGDTNLLANEERKTSILTTVSRPQTKCCTGAASTAQFLSMSSSPTVFADGSPLVEGKPGTLPWKQDALTLPSDTLTTSILSLHHRCKMREECSLLGFVLASHARILAIESRQLNAPDAVRFRGIEVANICPREERVFVHCPRDERGKAFTVGFCLNQR